MKKEEKTPEKKQEKEKKPLLSNQAVKFWIGLFVIVLTIGSIILFFVYSWHALFRDNPRLVLSEIQICGMDGAPDRQGYWVRNSVGDREARVTELASILNLKLDETNLYALDLAALRTNLLQRRPEIEKVKIVRVMPDLLVFHVVERIPRARVNTRARNLLVDEKGIVLDAAACAFIPKNLPLLTVFPRMPSLKPGDRLQDSNMLLALAFLRMIELDFPQIRIEHIYSITTGDGNRSLRCTLFYRNDPTPFELTLPGSMNENMMNNDIPERLIPRLNKSLENRTLPHNIDLTFNNLSVSRQEQPVERKK